MVTPHTKAPPDTNPTPNPVTLPSTGFIRLADLVKFVPFGKATIWRKCKDEKSDFPRPVKLSDRVTAWRVEDIRAWINKQGATA